MAGLTIEYRDVIERRSSRKRIYGKRPEVDRQGFRQRPLQPVAYDGFIVQIDVNDHAHGTDEEYCQSRQQNPPEPTRFGCVWHAIIFAHTKEKIMLSSVAVKACSKCAKPCLLERGTR